MARPRSDDKRKAILNAAAQVVAERGLAAAPTSAISRAAGVAEGTLFTYFATKDELINALYRALKAEVADHLLQHYPVEAGVRATLEHLWNGFVSWGVANPAKRKVLAQLNLTDTVTAESREAGLKPFIHLEQLGRESVASGILRDYPVQFMSAMLSAMTETTMTFIAMDSANAEKYCRDGYEMFWNAIAVHPGARVQAG